MNHLTLRETPPDYTLPQELAFLNVTGSPALDDNARDTIRAQSLKDYHRKRKFQRSVGTGGAAPSSGSQASKTHVSWVQRFRLGSGGLQPTRTQPQPGYASKTLQASPSELKLQEISGIKQSHERGEEKKEHQIHVYQDSTASLLAAIEISRGQVDPFNTLPMPSTPRIQLLIKQLMTRINSNSPTRDYRRYWFEHASQDLACFYIAMCQSASDGLLTLQKGRPAEAVMYQNKALQIISQRLSDPTWQVHNTTIGAVAALASYEISNGSLEAARAHLLGMERMIYLRGGIDDPSISSGLRRVVPWVDLVATSHDIPASGINSHQYSFHMLSSTGKADETMNSGKHVGSSQRSPSAEELVADIDGDLRILSAAKASQRFAVATIDEEIVFGEKAYLVQRRLMELTGTSESSVRATWTVNTIWALAASIYSSVILFEISINSLIVETLVVRLQQCMEALMERDSLAAVTKAIQTDSKLFWAIALSGIASENTPQRKWFVNLLHTIFDTLGPSHESAITSRRALATDVLWDSSLDALARRLWTEVDCTDKSAGLGGEVF